MQNSYSNSQLNLHETTDVVNRITNEDLDGMNEETQDIELDSAGNNSQEVAGNDESTNPRLAAALDYAGRGWPVIPLYWPQADGSCACGNPNCHSIGKHPIQKGWTNDISDSEQIRKLWTRWPQANIGIVTGWGSGLIVIDVDTKGNGPKRLTELEQVNGKLPETIQATTGSGGKHFVFKCPDHLKIPNRARFDQGLDVRSDGGMFVAPPSIHASGRQYEWVISPDQAEPAECPDWAIRLMTAKNINRVQNGSSPSAPIIEGGRNSTLTSMAGAMRRHGMTNEAILAALVEQNNALCRPPLDGSEVVAIAQSISRYEPRSAGSRFPLTELGNAERLVHSYGEDLRFCHPWNKWLVWDGKRWAIDATSEIDRKVCTAIRKMLAEAETINDEGERKALVKWELRSESSRSRREIIDHAKRLEGIPILPEDMDQHKWIFNANNGEIDLKTGELLPHRRENLITKLAKVDFDPDAECPLWNQVLYRIMGKSQSLIDFLQKAVGYALTGDTGEQCLFILWGSGANGKSTFLDTISALLGDDYAQNTPTQTLMARRGEGIPNDIAALKGARFVTAIEAEEGQRFAESLLKSMTGGDKLTARFMRGEFFSFTPEFKLFLATNHKPQIRGTDNAIWRRIHLIPFEVTIPPEERDRNLVAKLRKELPGILNWAIEGCLKWQQEGLCVPDEVRAATIQYKAEMDTLGDFLAECCVEGDNLTVENIVLYKIYTTWCEANNERPVGQKMFSSRMVGRGFTNPRGGTNGRRIWAGLGLKPSTDGLTVTDGCSIINNNTNSYSTFILKNPSEPVSDPLSVSNNSDEGESLVLAADTEVYIEVSENSETVNQQDLPDLPQKPQKARGKYRDF